MGVPFASHADKMNAYSKFLFRPPGQEALPEDDLVVFLDSYDVLLLPHIANIDRVMARSETPILFCAESSMYPEYSGASFVAFLLSRGSIE